MPAGSFHWIIYIYDIAVICVSDDGFASLLLAISVWMGGRSRCWGKCPRGAMVVVRIGRIRGDCNGSVPVSNCLLLEELILLFF